MAAEVPGRAGGRDLRAELRVEVAPRQPTAVVAAVDDAGGAAIVQRAFSTPAFRVYTTDDVRGVELGGALKNVMAVATGIADGLGLGHNSRAALITRGLAEMTRLGVALGARAATFAGLAGHGRPRAHVHRRAEPQSRGRRRDRARARRWRTSLAGTRDRRRGRAERRRARVALAARAGVEHADRRSGVSHAVRGSQPPGEAIAELMMRANCERSGTE